MQRKLNLISKIFVFIVSFLFVFTSVQAACTPEPKKIDKAANDSGFSCRYEKRFFKEDTSTSATSKYFDYLIKIELKMLYDPGADGWNFSRISKTTDGFKACVDKNTQKTIEKVCIGYESYGIFQCDGDDNPVLNWDTSEIAPADRINPYQVVDVPKLPGIKEERDILNKKNHDFEDQKYYREWLHENENELCPPYVVISYYNEDDYLVAASKYGDIEDVYNNTLTYQYSSNAWNDYLNPRIYGESGYKNGFKEVLPLVSAGDEKVTFTINEYAQEMSDLMELTEQIDEQVVSECNISDASGINTGSNDAPNLTRLLMANKVKLENVEKKAYESTASSPTYIKLKEINDAFVDHPGSTACEFFANEQNKEEKKDATAELAEVEDQLKDDPENEDLLAKKEELEKRIAELDEAIKEFESKFGMPTEPIEVNCDSFGDVLFEIFTILMIAAPILLIVYGTIDFGKATLSSDEDAVKAAGKNFGKRAIAAVLLFILPTIISIILGVAADIGIIKEQENCFVEETEEQTSEQAEEQNNEQP